MSGTYQYDVEIKSNVAELLSNMKQVQDRLDTVEGREYTVKLNIDEKKLSNVISNLEKMLNSLGKGTGDFKQFENLSKELSTIMSEAQSLSKAFGKVDDSGTKTLLSSIHNIDKSLSDLSQNILNVNKNMSNMGGNTNNAVKQIENITYASKEAVSAINDIANAKSKINDSNSNNILKAYQSYKKEAEDYNKVSEKSVELASKLSEKLNDTKTSYKYKNERRGNRLNKFYDDIDQDGKNFSKSELNEYLKTIPKTKKDIKSFMDKTFDHGTETDVKNLQKIMGGYFSYLDIDSNISEKKISYIKSFTEDYFKQWELLSANLESTKNKIKPIIKDLLNSLNIDAHDFDIDQLLTNGFLDRISLNDIGKNPIKNVRKIFDKYNQTISNNFGLVDVSEINNVDELDKKIGEMISKRNKLEDNYVKSLYTGDGDHELQKELNLLDEKIVAYSKLQSIVKDQRFQESNISSGNTTPPTPPKKDRYAKRRKISEEDFLNYSPNRVNEKLSNSGYTILGETVNTELVDGLVKVSAKIKDADGAWKSFSAKVDADGNIFEQRFKTVTNGVDKLETALQNFGRETAPALTYQETLDKAQKIKNSLNLGDEYSIKVDSSEFVTITKKFTDVENAGASVTQTFKSAQDAIDNFGKAASNSAEKTSVALKSVKSKDMKDAFQGNDDFEKEQKETEAIKRQKDAYESLMTTIKEYGEVYKSLANGQGDSNDNLSKMSSLKAKISELQKKGILSESQIEKSENALTKIYNQVDKIEQKFKETSKIDLTKFKDKTNDVNIDKLSKRTVSDDNNKDNFKTLLSNISKKKEELLQLINELEKKTVTPYDIKNVKNLSAELDELKKKAKDISIAPSNAVKFQRVFSELTKLEKQYPKATERVRELRAEFEKQGKDLAVTEALADIDRLRSELISTNAATHTLWATMKEKAFFNLAQQLGTYFSFYDVINGIKRTSEAVIQLNTDITELAKVSEASTSQIYDDFDSYADIAKEIGGTISDTISATADWSKNGYSIPDAKQLAEVSQLYKNVGDGIDIDSANESLISTLKGFQLEADQAEHIVDVFNEVDILASYYSNVIALCV